MNRVNISHIQLYAFTGGTKGGDHQIKKQNKKDENSEVFLFAPVREWQQDYVLYMENQL